MSLQAGGKSTIPLKSLSNVEVGLLVAHIAATVLPILSKHYHDFIKCGINGENLCDLEVNEELKEYGITIPLLAFKQFHRLIEAFKKNEVPRHIIDNANTEKPASILMTLETNLVDESGIATLADHRMDASMYHTDESPHVKNKLYKYQMDKSYIHDCLFFCAVNVLRRSPYLRSRSSYFTHLRRWNQYQKL